MRPLRKHQKKGLKYALKQQHPAIFWDMRTGKTLLFIRIEKVWKSKHILVTAPYSAILNWEEDLTLEGESFTTLDGPLNSKIIERKTMENRTVKGRRELLEEQFDKSRYIIVSKECHRYMPELADYAWDSVVIDESHHIRNKNGMADFYCDNFREAKHRTILTGTPAPTSELDYFNQIKFLEHAYWGGVKNYYGFSHKYFTMVNYKTYLRTGSYDKIAKVLADRANILRRHELDLGADPIETTRVIKFTNKVRKIYNTVEEEFALKVNEEYRNETVWAPVKHLWLKRLCGGWTDREFISYGKINELMELLKNQLQDEQVVILCHFKKEGKKIAKLLSKYFKIGLITGDVSKRKRKEIIGKFRAGELQHVVCQCQAVVEGVNFSNADTMIFYSLPESPLIYQQVKDRIVTIANKQAKFIIYLLVEKTVEILTYKAHKFNWSRQKKMDETIKYLQYRWRKSA